MSTSTTILCTKHQEHLHESAIADDIISQRGYRSIAPGSIHEWREIAGAIHSDAHLKRILHGGALTFPLFRPGEKAPYTWVLRPDIPRKSADGKPVKYEYPKSTANVLDVLPRYHQALKNPDIPIWITEGTKKADALASAYGDSIVPINENGVWGWRSKGKIVEDFNRVLWEGRRVIIAPDGDVRANKAVYQAVQRAARALMAQGCKEVLICLLPNPKDAKVGVDDFLGQGNSIEQLEAHLVELDAVAGALRVSLLKHPVTGAPLYLPPGYDIQNKTIVRTGPEGSAAFYSGLIAVTGTGKNLHTQEETATVVWKRLNHIHEVAMPRVEMTTGSRCADFLGRVGVFVHPINAREMGRYLTEFIQENDEALPRVDYVDRLGNVEGGGLVLPAGGIELPNETKYTGPTVQMGTDPEAYQRVLRNVADWNSTPTLWAALAFALAGPALARIRPERNPVLILAGGSGSGKTTLAHFACGAYGDPTRAPLSIQCGSGTTTPKGIQQTLTQINGIPTHLEDVHMMMEREPLRFAGLIYDFANGQLRTYGTLNQKGGGGQDLGGTMLMTGEMIPEFAHAGSQNRIMLFDCTRTPPLGVPAKSAEGRERAAVLDSSWRAGAGLFGHQVCETLWANWATFLTDYATAQGDPCLGDVQAWRPLLAAAATVLRVALLRVYIDLDITTLMRQWAAILKAGQLLHDPAHDAFDRVLVMLSQCEMTDDSGIDSKGQRTMSTWRWLHYERKMVAAQRVGDTYWRVLTTSPQWKAMIGAGIIDMFGEAWLKTNLVQSHSIRGAGVSERVYTGPGKGNLQCVLLPAKHFTPPENL